MHVHTTRTAFDFVFWLLTITLLGCQGDHKVATHPVTGRVFVRGEMAAGAKLVFHPSSSTYASAALFPTATADGQGHFRVTTYDLGDGAPPGEYTVTISWRNPLGATDPDELHPDELSSSPELIEQIHRDPDTSPWTVTIKSGDNSLPPFHVK